MTFGLCKEVWRARRVWQSPVCPMAPIAWYTLVADGLTISPVRSPHFSVYLLPDILPAGGGGKASASDPQRMSSTAMPGCSCLSRQARRSGVMPSSAAALGSAWAQSSAWATSAWAFSTAMRSGVRLCSSAFSDAP